MTKRLQSTELFAIRSIEHNVIVVHTIRRVKSKHAIRLDLFLLYDLTKHLLSVVEEFTSLVSGMRVVEYLGIESIRIFALNLPSSEERIPVNVRHESLQREV